MAETFTTTNPGQPGPGRDELEGQLAGFRHELTGYCYRMLGSVFEADDAVQETMVRAWRKLDGFEGRSSLRSWLYRIATNVCLDLLRGRKRRAVPMELGPASPAETLLGAPLPEHSWVQPIPDSRVLDLTDDPAELAAARETIRLAFVTALQHLPPRQRAILILREVLRWQATEVAELLDTTVASVNSALQRARATLTDTRNDTDADADGLGADSHRVNAEDRELLASYVDAFERYDISSLVTLLHHDATFSMPPFALWLQGHDDIAKWYVGQGHACEGSRLIATAANGSPAFGAYKLTESGTREPFALQVIEIRDGAIAGLHHFLGPELFEVFGLPAVLDA